MSSGSLPEVWLRGPLKDINPYLQPVAHALLQAAEEVTELMKDFPEELLSEKPAGVASPTFHLQHLSGVLDRLFTYAKGDMLSQEQLQVLKKEGIQDETITIKTLVENFTHQVNKSLEQLKKTDAATLTDFRGVGRAQLPSTVLGLMVHAAEHTMRHVGQLLVTVRIIKDGIKF
jgi:uncharacterized damage-inducible protein DinB